MTTTHEEKLTDEVVMDYISDRLPIEGLSIAVENYFQRFTIVLEPKHNYSPGSGGESREAYFEHFYNTAIFPIMLGLELNGWNPNKLRKLESQIDPIPVNNNYFEGLDRNEIIELYRKEFTVDAFEKSCH